MKDWSWVIPSLQMLSTTFLGIITLVISRGQLQVSRSQAEIGRRLAEVNEGQLHLARAKVRQDLFERRLSLYDRVREHLSRLIAQQVPTFQQNAAFLQDKKAARWLYGSSVDDVLQAIYNRTADFEATVQELDGLPHHDPSRPALIHARKQHNLWFFEQSRHLDDVFGPFLILEPE